jgi:hypothetical protein
MPLVLTLPHAIRQVGQVEIEIPVRIAGNLSDGAYVGKFEHALLRRALRTGVSAIPDGVTCSREVSVCAP